MNEFYELHKRTVVFLAILVAAGALLWFVLGSSLYAGMVKDRNTAASLYNEYDMFFGRGVPVEAAEAKYRSELGATTESLESLRKALGMKFHDYVSIPADQARTKMPYFDKMLYEVRENINMLASVNKTAVPPAIGWPDFIDVPVRDQDVTVPMLLRKLSVTDRLLTLLISSRAGKSQVREIKSIQIGDPYTEAAGTDYPQIVRCYPVSVNFTCTINALLKFLAFIHYVESPDRKVGQFFEVEYIDVSWNDDNPTPELKVSCRLNALEFIVPEPSTVVPRVTTEPGKPLGY